ncbi:MAG: PAS domain-containing sensor histidine kinase [Ahrensia sp.]|nr:PAS domain-containing sensor histidine kinase [Ahrensia sp.]
MTSADIAPGKLVLDPARQGPSTLRYARKFGLAVVIVAIAFGFASFLILLGLTPLEPTGTVILTVLSINAVFVGIMLLLVVREVRVLLLARRRGRAAARMHIRIVGLFGVVAAFPAIVVAIVAGITLDLGLDRIFDNRTRTIVDNSISVAQSYVDQATSSLNGHAVNMGLFMNRNLDRLRLDPRGFQDIMTGQARARGLVGVSIVRQDGTATLEANIPSQSSIPPPETGLLDLAADGRPACIQPRTQNLAMCAFKLSGFADDRYLYAVSSVDPAVLNSIQLMREITQEYEVLESGRLPLQIAFALLYVGICLTILLSAIWMGIAVADRLVEPIRRLISAADEIAAGNLAVTVPASKSEGELRSLTDTFNLMTLELRSQRDEILDNQEQIDNRRRFTEAVLSGVTAGVIGISAEGRVAIANRSALRVLADENAELVGKRLEKVSPELAAVLEAAKSARKADHREQITLMRGGEERTLNVQVTGDTKTGQEESRVITIDDITDLVSAQRTSAWADVARRIAHEIKNPLTPIQLSAERIRRRYGKVITQDREVFDQCTDTIVRQVADIGRMVDEFSSFARMPKPSMVEGDLAEAVREAVFLLKVSNPDISFEVDLGTQPLFARFDTRLLTQAFGNLVKNATEAMEDVVFEEGEGPCIDIRASQSGDRHVIDVIDNGKGLPAENRQRLLEPYMTTREKGTGLGLAIVGKIVEEHHGSIELRDAPSVAQGGRGAMVRVSLPALQALSDTHDMSASSVEEGPDGR